MKRGEHGIPHEARWERRFMTEGTSIVSEMSVGGPRSNGTTSLALPEDSPRHLGGWERFHAPPRLAICAPEPRWSTGFQSTWGVWVRDAGWKPALRFMGRENLQNLDANRGHEPAGSVLPASCRQMARENCRRDADSTFRFMERVSSTAFRPAGWGGRGNFNP